MCIRQTPYKGRALQGALPSETISRARGESALPTLPHQEKGARLSHASLHHCQTCTGAVRGVTLSASTYAFICTRGEQSGVSPARTGVAAAGDNAFLPCLCVWLCAEFAEGHCIPGAHFGLPLGCMELVRILGLLRRYIGALKLP